MKARIKELKFSREHLNLVLNLDFNRPSKELIELAKAAHVDLKDENMLEEFKLVQIQSLEDIRRMKNGQ